ncbi:MAG: tRNA (adenosine(37)-N6)-dimethylallyltransferase MiaA [Deltaproteobacteria bacterium]|nr:tRNA (adenosine(37)-N6)-dimethylallyltransferase MiaA [Deltaproteobacteria bacterium]
MTPAKPRIVCIVGATGVGKTDVALDVAERVDAEIVSADSMQVYRYMDIGTAKPTPAQRGQVPHHLLDVVDPDEDFNAALFREHALAAIADIRARERNVLVVGGTGLYLKALTRGLFEGPGRDNALRADLERAAVEHGVDHLFERLERVDPESARRIERRDRVRIVRALEVHASTGRPLSEWQREHGFDDRPFDVLGVALERSRAELYARIDRRCGEMLAAGLLDETRALLERGYHAGLRSMQSVGYRQAVQRLTDLIGEDDTLAAMRQATRRLAKRQLTWFRADPDLQRLHPDRVDAITGLCARFLDGR